MSEAIYKDSNRSVEARVEDLLSQMTVQEKIMQLTSTWPSRDLERGAVSPDEFVKISDDLFVDIKNGIGQFTRLYGTLPVDPKEGARKVNKLQEWLVKETRLGIPAICHEECLTGFMCEGATSFPSPLNYSSTWDPDLMREVGSVIRRQMRAAGTHQGLAPVCDVARDARWGRIEETMGEDPYLVGCMVTNYVKGLQGPDIKEGIIATLKHFAGYSFSEGGRNFAPAHLGKRELEDVFLLPFEMAVKSGGALSVMNAYQDIDGEPPAASHMLLTDILRGKWGFDGFVVADYGAVTMLKSLHRVAASSEEAAAMALKAGLDVELPGMVDFPLGLKTAFDNGLIEMADLDQAVRRVLNLKFRLGLFENPYVDVDSLELDLPEEQALAAKVAEKSVTLLSNNGILPLDPKIKKLAVIGPNAHEIKALFGDYSFENQVLFSLFPELSERVQAVTVLEALRAKLGDDKIIYAKGCEIMDAEIMDDSEDGLDEAVKAALEAEIAVVVLGDRAGLFRKGTVGEGTDTFDLSLPGGQAKLVREVMATGTPTVVVLLNGRPFAMPEVADNAAAILETWFPGQEGAGIISDVLFGKFNPGGKTTVSFSRSAGAMPYYYNHKFLAQGLAKHPDFDPVFPFGHGLSYTTFEYSDISLSLTEIPSDGQVEISMYIENTGNRAGEEVVQLYCQDLLGSVSRPIKELKGFLKIGLDPREKRKITFNLPADMLSFVGLDYKRVVEPGEIRIMIGASSDDIRLEETFTLFGENYYPGEDRALFTEVTVE